MREKDERESNEASMLDGTSGGSGGAPCHSYSQTSGESEGKRTELPVIPPEPPKPPDILGSTFPEDVIGSIPYPSLKDLEKSPERQPLVDPSYGDSGATAMSEEEKDEEPKQREIGGTKIKEHTENQSKRNKRANKAKQMKDFQRELFENYNRVFGSEEGWATYLTMETERKMNIAQIERSLLRIHRSAEMMVRKTNNRENQYLIKTTSKMQSDAYIKINQINGQKVTITPHSDMNSVWGSVLIWELGENDESTYLEILQNRYQNVEEVKLVQITRKRKEGEQENTTNQGQREKQTNILKIKFKGETLPNKVVFEGTNKEVRPYVPRPNQCYTCLKYGHWSGHCRSNVARCYRCGSPDHDPRYTRCPNEELCFNCKGDHNARAEKCVFYAYYTQVRMMQKRTGMTMREAKITLRSKGVEDPYIKQSYSQVAKEQVRGERDEDKTNRTPERKKQGNQREATRDEEETKNSPCRNRYSLLNEEDISEGFWEDPLSAKDMKSTTGAKGKRVRESPSPKSQHTRAKKPKEPKEDQEEKDTEKQNSKGKQEDHQKIQTLVSTRTLSSWDEMEDQIEPFETRETPKAKEYAREENDMTGVRTEMEAYKKQIQEKDKKTNETQTKVSQHMKGCRCDKCIASPNTNPNVHREECSCEICFYRTVRELKYRTDRNIALVMDDYMEKPPLKEISQHPNDCLCGAHLQIKIKQRRVPYSKLVRQVIKNKFRP